MRLSMLLHEAWLSIGANRLRTFLAMLGIVIGVGSVVLMMAIGTGSQRAIEEMIGKLGTNLLMVTPGSGERRIVRGTDISTLTEKDAEAIKQVPSVLASVPTMLPQPFQVLAAKNNWNTRVTGTVPDYFTVNNWTFAEGDGFSDEDVRLNRRVAVIGDTVREKLFKNESALGRTVHINNMPFIVAGVLEAKGQSLDGRDQDDAIFVPLSTARSKLSGRDYGANLVQTIIVQIVSEDDINQAMFDIRELLRDRHRLHKTSDADFTIRNLTAIVEVASETTRALSLLLGAIASISLVVGGIGIMNIMLVTVSERTREIGIRKAIGASEKKILLQFLMEAVMIASVGSFFGLGSGVGFGLLAEHYFSLVVAFNMWSAVLSLSVAGIIGVTSGLYPALKASRLAPIDALRTVGA